MCTLILFHPRRNGASLAHYIDHRRSFSFAKTLGIEICRAAREHNHLNVQETTQAGCSHSANREYSSSVAVGSLLFISNPRYVSVYV